MISCVPITFVLHGLILIRSMAGDELTLNGHAHPLDVVASAEEIARHHGVKPISLLLLDLGSILTEGSFNTKAFLLSLKPSTRLQPRIKVHTELWQALAAPLKIVVVVFQGGIFGNINYFGSDFTQNIRHKFLFLFITRTDDQDKKLGEYTGISGLTTVIWSGNKPQRSWCCGNRDNLFWEYEHGSCNLKRRACGVESINESSEVLGIVLRVTYKIRVKCNTTWIRVYRAVVLPTLTRRERQSVLSSLNVLEEGTSGCHTFIPMVNADVTALLKPFDETVWCLILMNITVLAVAWALIVRQSASHFTSQISLNLIAVREVTLVPKSFSSTVIGCAALAFSFLIGRLYSNTVMSYFVDPVGDSLPLYLPFDCRMNTICYYPKSLDSLFDYVAVCNVPPPLFVSVRAPVRTVQASRLFGRRDIFNKLDTDDIPTPTLSFGFMILVPTQRSESIDRIIRHGIISPARLEVHELRSLMARRVDQQKTKLKANLDEHFAYSYVTYVKTLAPSLPLPPGAVGYVSFNTTREWFDADSFLKMRPLIVACSLSIAVTMGIELGFVKRRWIFAQVAVPFGAIGRVLSTCYANRPRFGVIRNLIRRRLLRPTLIRIRLFIISCAQ